MHAYCGRRRLVWLIHEVFEVPLHEIHQPCSSEAAAAEARVFAAGSGRKKQERNLSHSMQSATTDSSLPISCYTPHIKDVWTLKQPQQGLPAVSTEKGSTAQNVTVRVHTCKIGRVEDPREGCGAEVHLQHSVVQPVEEGQSQADGVDEGSPEPLQRSNEGNKFGEQPVAQRALGAARVWYDLVLPRANALNETLPTAETAATAAAALVEGKKKAIVHGQRCLLQIQPTVDVEC